MLRAAGVLFRVVVPAVDETLEHGETGERAAERIARAKAAVVDGNGDPVLAADTLVVCAGAVLGKPRNDDDARSMLSRLAGRTHEVVTGVCLVIGRDLRSGVERTRVSFGPMTDTDIDAYVATGEPRDRAGAYHIDGRCSFFIEAVEGSPSNVAGLPMRLVLRLAQELGVGHSLG